MSNYDIFSMNPMKENYIDKIKESYFYDEQIQTLYIYTIKMAQIIYPNAMFGDEKNKEKLEVKVKDFLYELEKYMYDTHKIELKMEWNLVRDESNDSYKVQTKTKSNIKVKYVKGEDEIKVDKMQSILGKQE